MNKGTSKPEKRQESRELENRCWEYLKPFLEDLHRRVDRRLVKTLLDLVLVIFISCKQLFSTPVYPALDLFGGCYMVSSELSNFTSAFQYFLHIHGCSLLNGVLKDRDNFAIHTAMIYLRLQLNLFIDFFRYVLDSNRSRFSSHLLYRTIMQYIRPKFKLGLCQFLQEYN